MVCKEMTLRGLGSEEGFSIRSAKVAATYFLSDLLFFHGYLFTLKERKKKGIINYTPGEEWYSTRLWSVLFS